MAVVTRDEYGVPHVRGDSARDAWTGMGYACAQDRLFQLDYDRRRACGRWAEIAGPAAVGDDALARRLRLAGAAKRDISEMSPETLAMFEAYANGVNAAIADGAAPLPGTYAVEPWEAWHSVAMFKVRHVLMGPWQRKLAQAVLLARIGPDAFAKLETRPPLGSPLAVPPGGRLSRLVDQALLDVTGHLGFLAEAEPGSNAWAVSGARTAHGGAVICNDSHRALDTPNVYWQCHLSCPEFDVTGATFPGLPGFPHFGFNGSVAWAITHADTDNQDLYIERFDGSRYLTPDGWAEATHYSERIEVLGSDPVSVDVWETVHGPVVHGEPTDGYALALKYTATYRPDRGFECLRPMLTASSVRQMADAQEGWTDPVNNLVCADTSGDIAYQCRGLLPVRSSPAHRGLPAPGWDGSAEWTSTVPFGSLPRTISPDAGFVMTANNAITDGDEPYISYTFAQPFRAERLRSHLASSGSLTVASLAEMQADTVSLAASGWARVLREMAVPVGSDGPDNPGGSGGLSGDAERARAMLAGWDGNLRADSGPALLYGCFVRSLAEALYRPVLGDEAWAWVASGTLAPSINLVRRWLANDTWELLGCPVPGSDPVSGTAGAQPAPPVPEISGMRRSASASASRVLAVVPDALAAAWEAAVRQGGPDPASWRWGDVHQAVRSHPLSSARPLSTTGEAPAGHPSPDGRFPAIPPDGEFPATPMGGDSDTIQAAGFGWVPGTPFTVTSLSVYRQVIDLADPASASYVIPGGASGDPASPHFADQLAQWAKHQRIPMR
ncbi:MAG: penicillin acylase family protein [Nocardiopsaceae bacterium]|nr:penicillin acylase family protein [Nocardiopsaceae bacterium]